MVNVANIGGIIKMELKDFEKEKNKKYKDFFKNLMGDYSDKPFKTYSKKILIAADILHLIPDNEQIIIKSSNSGKILFDGTVRSLKSDGNNKSHVLCDKKVIQIVVGDEFEFEMIIES